MLSEERLMLLSYKPAKFIPVVLENHGMVDRQVFSVQEFEEFIKDDNVAEKCKLKKSRFSKVIFLSTRLVF